MFHLGGVGWGLVLLPSPKQKFPHTPAAIEVDRIFFLDELKFLQKELSKYLCPTDLPNPPPPKKNIAHSLAFRSVPLDITRPLMFDVLRCVGAHMYNTGLVQQ